MRRTYLTSWHNLLILAAVVLSLTGRNHPSNSQTETLVLTWEVYFSPHGGATSAILRTLDHARKSILVQAYSFTSVPIASALGRAHKWGVDVHLPITCLRVLFEFEGLQVAIGAVDLASLGTMGSTAVVLLLLDAQHYGLLIAQIFFGVWLAPLGYLVYNSGWFPKSSGVVLIPACASDLVDFLEAFLLPNVGIAIHGFAIILPTIAEPWMVLYLLVVGIKTQNNSKE